MNCVRNKWRPFKYISIGFPRWYNTSGWSTHFFDTMFLVLKLETSTVFRVVKRITCKYYKLEWYTCFANFVRSVFIFIFRHGRLLIDYKKKKQLLVPVSLFQIHVLYCNILARHVITSLFWKRENNNNLTRVVCVKRNKNNKTGKSFLFWRPTLNLIEWLQPNLWGFLWSAVKFCVSAMASVLKACLRG